MSFSFCLCLQARSQNSENWLLVSSCPSVRQSVRMEQLGCHQTDLQKIWFWSIFRKSVEKIQVSLKSGKITPTLREAQLIFLSFLAQFFFEWEKFQTKVVEKIKIHILCSITFSWKLCRLWDYMEKYRTDDNIIRRMRFSCRITKDKNTHTEYEMLIVFALQQRLCERAWMLRLTYIACLVLLIFSSQRSFTLRVLMFLQWLWKLKASRKWHCLAGNRVQTFLLNFD